ncbi:MAG: flagellar hook-basal body complex protein FliE [Clostridiales bacterium]|nr:flagellar hook-basal body complex protein FliE [Clostridiales bacterium]
MAIIPVKGAEIVNSQFSATNTQNKQESFVSFSDIFKNAINEANDAEAAAQQSKLLVATGQADDLHTLMINTAKAELALDTLVQMRNKAMDAYNEIMKMSL